MELTHKKDQQGHSIVTCKVSKEEVRKYSDASVNELAAKISIPGFRKGHVPADVAIRYIKNEDLNNNLINRIIRKAIKAVNTDQNIVKEFYFDMFVNADPAINVTKFDAEGVELEISILLLPKVDKLAQISGLEIKTKNDRFSQKLVTEELERLQNNEGSLVPTTEALAKGDHVSLDIQVYVAGTRRKDYEGGNIDLVIGENRSILKDKEEDLIGKKVGDKASVIINTGENMPAELANTELEIRYEIVSADKKELPTLDDEFAKSQTTYKDVETLEALKEAITKSIKSRLAEVNKNRKITAIYDDILKNTTFVVDSERIRKDICRIQEAKDRQELAQKGVSLEDYLKINSMSYEEYLDKIFNYVYRPLQIRALEEAIYSQEKETFKEPTKEEVAKYHKMESLDKYEQQLRDYFKMMNPEASDAEVSTNVAQQIGWLFSDYRKHQLDEYLFSNNK